MSSRIGWETQICVSPDQVFSFLGDEAVILHLTDGTYYGLDPVGALVWKLIQEPRPVSAIATAIQDEFEVDADRCRRDLLDLLQDMETAGLLRVQKSDAM